MLHRAATRAGEPLAWRAVPHLRNELSATSQIRIGTLPHLAFFFPLPHLHRDLSPRSNAHLSSLLLHSLPVLMPKLPLKLFHAIVLSPHYHICIGTGLPPPWLGSQLEGLKIYSTLSEFESGVHMASTQSTPPVH